MLKNLKWNLHFFYGKYIFVRLSNVNVISFFYLPLIVHPLISLYMLFSRLSLSLSLSSLSRLSLSLSLSLSSLLSLSLLSLSPSPLSHLSLSRVSLLSLYLALSLSLSLSLSVLSLSLSLSIFSPLSLLHSLSLSLSHWILWILCSRSLQADGTPDDDLDLHDDRLSYVSAPGSEYSMYSTDSRHHLRLRGHWHRGRAYTDQELDETLNDEVEPPIEPAITRSSEPVREDLPVIQEPPGYRGYQPEPLNRIDPAGFKAPAPQQ